MAPLARIIHEGHVNNRAYLKGESRLSARSRTGAAGRRREVGTHNTVSRYTSKV